MKLKLTEAGNEVKLEKDEATKKGKRSKRKGSNYERTIAKRFADRYGVDFKRTPQSGGFAKASEIADDFRGDIVTVDNKMALKLHIECKDHKTWSLPKWISQAESDCPKSRKPVVVFHQYGTSKDYVCLSLSDFLELVEKDKVVEKRKFND